MPPVPHGYPKDMLLHSRAVAVRPAVDARLDLPATEACEGEAEKLSRVALTLRERVLVEQPSARGSGKRRVQIKAGPRHF